MGFFSAIIFSEIVRFPSLAAMTALQNTRNCLDNIFANCFEVFKRELGKQPVCALT